MSKELIGVKFPPYGDFKTGISSLVLCWGALQSSYCCNLTLFTSLDPRFFMFDFYNAAPQVPLTLHPNYISDSKTADKIQSNSFQAIHQNCHDTKTWKPDDKYSVGQSLSDESILLKLSLHLFKTLVLNLLTVFQGFQGHHSSDFKIGCVQSMAYAANQSITEKS